MADQADIDIVKDLFPAEEAIWDDEKIGRYLDAGKTGPEILQAFWEGKAASLHSMIDISESGSSRSLSRLYDNAIRLAEYWGNRVRSDKEDLEKDEDDRPTTFGRITRV